MLKAVMELLIKPENRAILILIFVTFSVMFISLIYFITFAIFSKPINIENVSIVFKK